MHNNTLIWIAFLTGMAFFATGCLSTRNVASSEGYRIELIPHEQILMTQAKAVAENGDLKVSGNIHLKGLTAIPSPGWVEVALVDHPSGSVIMAQQAASHPEQPTGRKHERSAFFSVRFSEMPPPGTRVRISFVN